MITLAIERSPLKRATLGEIAARKQQAKDGRTASVIICQYDLEWWHVRALFTRTTETIAYRQIAKPHRTPAPPGWIVHSAHCVVLQLDMHGYFICTVHVLIPDFCIHTGLHTDETISTPEPVKDACVCSTLHIQGGSVHKHYNRCPVHNDTEEHNCTRRNTVIGRSWWLATYFVCCMHELSYCILSLCVTHFMAI